MKSYHERQRSDSDHKCSLLMAEHSRQIPTINLLFSPFGFSHAPHFHRFNFHMIAFRLNVNENKLLLGKNSLVYINLVHCDGMRIRNFSKVNKHFVTNFVCLIRRRKSLWPNARFVLVSFLKRTGLLTTCVCAGAESQECGRQKLRIAVYLTRARARYGEVHSIIDSVVNLKCEELINRVFD